MPDEADELYGLPLEEFTAARDALAKRLRDDGDALAAGEVRGLRKPNLTAWALNQLARRHPEDLEELFGAIRRLRTVQRKVLSGGRAAALRQATDERNRTVSRLTKVAARILTDAGHAASASTRAGVTDSLMAVATDDQGADLLRRGVLVRPLEPGPLADVGGLSLVSGERAEEAEPPDPEELEAAVAASRAARERFDEAEAASRAATEEAERLTAAADEAERRAAAAREEAEFARRAADARRADASEAKADLDRAEQRLRRLGG